MLIFTTGLTQWTTSDMDPNKYVRFEQGRLHVYHYKQIRGTQFYLNGMGADVVGQALQFSLIGERFKSKQCIYLTTY